MVKSQKSHFMLVEMMQKDFSNYLLKLNWTPGKTSHDKKDITHNVQFFQTNLILKGDLVFC